MLHKFSIVLGFFILGPKSITLEHIDVFLTHVIEQLLLIWEEDKRCYDVIGDELFTLRAIIVLCIYDYLAYGIMAGITNKGFARCPICGPFTPSKSSLLQNGYKTCTK